MKIDEAEYTNGQHLAKTGTTLREMVELANDNDFKSTADRPGGEPVNAAGLTEDQAMSRIVGFAEGVLDMLRSKPAPAA